MLPSLQIVFSQERYVPYLPADCKLIFISITSFRLPKFTDQLTAKPLQQCFCNPLALPNYFVVSYKSLSQKINIIITQKIFLAKSNKKSSISFTKKMDTIYFNEALLTCSILNPCRPDPGRREKNNLNFYLYTSLWYLKKVL